VLVERSISNSDGTTRIEPFGADLARVQAWHPWLERWRKWVQQERPAREAMEVYERFYELYGELQREGERDDLFVGDGILFGRWEQGSIHFPVIMMPVQLEFRPNVPEFIIGETDRNPELHTALLRDAPLSNPVRAQWPVEPYPLTSWWKASKVVSPSSAMGIGGIRALRRIPE
jgi:hypothetical protein